MILMMICLGGCSNETVLSDDQIKEKIREVNTAAKLKEKFKNIGFDEMRDELLATVYDDQNSTLISYANEDGDTIRSELYSKDFRYSYGVEGEFSQEVYLAQREDVWQKAERYLSDMEFVKILYRTFLGREYDAPGLENWVQHLASGVSRDQVAAGFAYSQEFSEIMSIFGIK